MGFCAEVGNLPASMCHSIRNPRPASGFGLRCFLNHVNVRVTQRALFGQSQEAVVRSQPFTRASDVDTSTAKPMPERAWPRSQVDGPQRRGGLRGSQPIVACRCLDLGEAEAAAFIPSQLTLTVLPCQLSRQDSSSNSSCDPKCPTSVIGSLTSSSSMVLSVTSFEALPHRHSRPWRALLDRHGGHAPKNASLDTHRSTRLDKVS